MRDRPRPALTPSPAEDDRLKCCIARARSWAQSLRDEAALHKDAAGPHEPSPPNMSLGELVTRAAREAPALPSAGSP